MTRSGHPTYLTVTVVKATDHELDRPSCMRQRAAILGRLTNLTTLAARLRRKVVPHDIEIRDFQDPKSEPRQRIPTVGFFPCSARASADERKTHTVHLNNGLIVRLKDV
jgi:hypothetical protein